MVMKKTHAAVLLAGTMLFSCTACSEPEPAVDYTSVHDAVEAHKNGTDIVGKTIRVTATAPSIIYSEPDVSLMANLYVAIVNKDRVAEAASIQKGDVVIVTVDSVDDHLKNSIYLYVQDFTVQ